MRQKRLGSHPGARENFLAKAVRSRKGILKTELVRREFEGKFGSMCLALRGGDSQRKERHGFLLPWRKFMSVNKSLRVCEVFLESYSFRTKNFNVAFECLTT